MGLGEVRWAMAIRCGAICGALATDAKVLVRDPREAPPVLLKLPDYGIYAALIVRACQSRLGLGLA